LNRDIEVFLEFEGLSVFPVFRFERDGDRNGSGAGLLLDQETVVVRRNGIREGILDAGFKGLSDQGIDFVSEYRFLEIGRILTDDTARMPS
jgi:hypothetical protein